MKTLVKSQEDTKFYFYQSGLPKDTEIDLKNPLHQKLVDLILNTELPSKEANKLMKEIGLPQSVSLTNTPVWSSDIDIVERSTSTNLIVKWHSGTPARLWS